MPHKPRTGAVRARADESDAAAREPRQERGRRRVDEILDAAEALIGEVGPAACQVQELSRRAGASVGSIYHFFPTKDAIFDALRARYRAETHAMAAMILAHADEWARLDMRSFVERLISPFAAFIERTPAYFALATNSAGQRTKDPAADAAIRKALLTALARRAPGSTAAERALRVDVMVAIGDGISALMAHAAPPARRKLVEELKRAVFGYLATFEADRRAPP
jgi:AcrR family transcriptional regulator